MTLAIAGHYFVYAIAAQPSAQVLSLPRPASSTATAIATGLSNLSVMERPLNTRTCWFDCGAGLGGMGFTGADGPVSIGGRQQRRLLALLTLRAGSVASIDWRRDPISAEIIEYELAPEPCVFWTGDTDLNRLSVYHAEKQTTLAWAL